MTAARFSTYRDRFVGVDALAEVIQRSPKAVYDLKYRGLLPPAVRIGARILWLTEDIEAWLQGCKEVV